MEAFRLSDIVIIVEDVALPFAEASTSISSLLSVPGAVYSLLSTVIFNGGK